MADRELTITIYEDSSCENLYPIICLRPAFNILCGLASLILRVRNRFPQAQVNLLVRSQLQDATRDSFPDCLVNERVARTGLFVNGRVVRLPEAVVRGLDSKAYMSGDTMIAFRTRKEVTLEVSRDGVREERLSGISKELPKEGVDAFVLEHPWDVVRHNRDVLEADFSEFGAGRVLGVIDPLAVLMGDGTQFMLGAGSTVDPFCVIDVREGPVVIGNDVQVRAHSTVQGPCYLGDGSVIDGALIRPGTSVGPVSRLSGEVEESVFQGWSNKHHLGFMGHAWVGEWVNLGAGTNNSDLKNNYGRVRVGSPRGPLDTGLQKLGCFIGDHTKTGIGSLLNTGAVIGPFCSLLGGKVSPKYLPPFTWQGPEGFEKYRLDEAVATARAVMRRRYVEMGAGYEKAVADLYRRSGETLTGVG